MSPSVAVLGCGRWGPNLVRNFVDAGCTVWASDPRDDRVQSVCSRFPTVRSASTAQLLNQPDIAAIVLATPASTHNTLAIGALDAGKHVLVEKPMATTATEAAALAHHAQRAGLVLAVDHTSLFEPPTAALLQLAPTLGPPRSFHSQRLGAAPNRTDTDVLGDLAPHDLAVLFRFRPAPIESVSATGDLRDGVIAEATVQLHAATFQASLQFSWNHPHRLRTTRLVGAQGELDLPDATGPEPLKLLVNDFLQAIRTGRTPHCPGSTAVPIAAVIDSARHSIRAGGRSILLDMPDYEIGATNRPSR